MALLDFSPWESRSPLRPAPGGSLEPSFALKIEAQAAICVRIRGLTAFFAGDSVRAWAQQPRRHQPWRQDRIAHLSQPPLR